MSSADSAAIDTLPEAALSEATALLGDRQALQKKLISLGFRTVGARARAELELQRRSSAFERLPDDLLLLVLIRVRDARALRALPLLSKRCAGVLGAPGIGAFALPTGDLRRTRFARGTG